VFDFFATPPRLASISRHTVANMHIHIHTHILTIRTRAHIRTHSPHTRDTQIGTHSTQAYIMAQKHIRTRTLVCVISLPRLGSLFLSSRQLTRSLTHAHTNTHTSPHTSRGTRTRRSRDFGHPCSPFFKPVSVGQSRVSPSPHAVAHTASTRTHTNMHSAQICTTRTHAHRTYTHTHPRTYMQTVVHTLPNSLSSPSHTYPHTHKYAPHTHTYASLHFSYADCDTQPP